MCDRIIHACLQQHRCSNRSLLTSSCWLLIADRAPKLKGIYGVWELKFVGSMLVPVGMLKRMVKPLKTQNALVWTTGIIHVLYQPLKQHTQTSQPVEMNTATIHGTGRLSYPTALRSLSKPQFKRTSQSQGNLNSSLKLIWALSLIIRSLLRQE